MKSKIFTRIRGMATTKFAVSVFLVLLAVILLPSKARGQLGLDPCCAIISAGLDSISSLLKSVVATPLSSILQIQQQDANFEQQIVYPTASIDAAHTLANQFQTELTHFRQIATANVQSATLTSPQQLEQALLSRDTGSVAGVSSGYTAVFGSVMNSTDAPQPVRDVVDSTDAEAQAALKKAVLIDAMADAELQAAEDMNQQLQTASPGSTPMLDAQASTWLLRANASTQAAMAELVRVRAIELANESARLKFSSVHTTTLHNALGQSLQRSK